MHTAEPFGAPHLWFAQGCPLQRQVREGGAQLLQLERHAAPHHGAADVWTALGRPLLSSTLQQLRQRRQGLVVSAATAWQAGRAVRKTDGAMSAGQQQQRVSTVQAGIRYGTWCTAHVWLPDSVRRLMVVKAD